MPKLKMIKLNKISGFFKKLLITLAENPFLTSLTFILASLIIGSFIFYKYSILVEEKGQETQTKQLILEEDSFRNISKIWQEHQKRFDEADSRQYLNPFRLTK